MSLEDNISGEDKPSVDGHIQANNSNSSDPMSTTSLINE